MELAQICGRTGVLIRICERVISANVSHRLVIGSAGHTAFANAVTLNVDRRRPAETDVARLFTTRGLRAIAYADRSICS